RQRPVALAGTGADNFGILALLGNLAKLAWVLGGEKDQLRRLLADVAGQRRRASARSFSLDLLGRALRVPRFPPPQHSFDADTLALYHLDAVKMLPIGGVNVLGVEDEATQILAPGHPGVVEGGAASAPGKFGNGLRFANPADALALDA